MIGIAAMVAMAWAVPGEPEPVAEATSSGAVVDWTAQNLRAHAAGRIGGVDATQRIVEQDLRAQLGPVLLDGAREVRVRDGLTVGDLIARGDELGKQVGSAVGWWEVFEARYHASGRIELTGGIPIVDLVKPWALAVSEVREPDAWLKKFEVTGVVVDARGLPLVPAYAPKLVDPSGQVLFDGLLWQDLAPSRMPALYVSDPADEASVRAGTSPMIARAVGANGPDLVLTEDDAARFTALELSELLRRGALVIVIDAP